MLDTHSSSSFEQMRDEFQFLHFSGAHQLSRPGHGHGRPVPGNAKNMTRRNKCSTREKTECHWKIEFVSLTALLSLIFFFIVAISLSK